MERVKAAFLRFRGSNGFLVCFVVLLGSWWLAHLLFGYDPDKSTANFWMSAEASLTTSWLLDLSLKDHATFSRIEAKEDAVLVAHDDAGRPAAGDGVGAAEPAAEAET